MTGSLLSGTRAILFHCSICILLDIRHLRHIGIRTNPATDSRISKGCVDPRIVSFTQIIGHCCVKERAAPQAVITNLSMHLVRSEVVGNLDSLFWEAL